MRMAGLFDAWKGEDGEMLYTYTILTTDSSPRLQWCAAAVAAHLVALAGTCQTCLGCQWRGAGAGGVVSCSGCGYAWLHVYGPVRHAWAGLRLAHCAGLSWRSDALQKLRACLAALARPVRNAWAGSRQSRGSEARGGVRCSTSEGSLGHTRVPQQHYCRGVILQQ